MRKNSVKNRKINDEVRRVLAQIISGGIKDPRISPMTSVLAVEVAPDLKTCKVWVSVYGDDQKKQDTMEGLGSAAGFIRGEFTSLIDPNEFVQDKYNATVQSTSKLKGLSPLESRMKEMVNLNHRWFMQTLLDDKVANKNKTTCK